jgi:hypothetical protein
MRIKILRTPTLRDVDGIRLDLFQPGVQYEMGNSLGALFLAEGWGEPVASDEPAVLIPVREFTADAPPNLAREIYPPYYEGTPAFAADRRGRRHPRSPSLRHKAFTDLD